MLESILVDKAGLQRKLAAVLAKGPSKENGQARGNGAAAPAAPRPASGGAAPLSKRPAPGGAPPEYESRAGRTSKRKEHEGFEVEDPRGSKRPAAGAGGGAALDASRARLGIRQPSAAAALAAASLATESDVEVPMRGSMRLAGLPGHLKSIELVNFMCHEHFRMDFGQHVTFVSGTNGSGKSAVLQALQCCMGVKANQVRGWLVGWMAAGTAGAAATRSSTGKRRSCSSASTAAQHPTRLPAVRALPCRRGAPPP